MRSNFFFWRDVKPRSAVQVFKFRLRMDMKFLIDWKKCFYSTIITKILIMIIIIIIIITVIIIIINDI